MAIPLFARTRFYRGRVRTATCVHGVVPLSVVIVIVLHFHVPLSSRGRVVLLFSRSLVFVSGQTTKWVLFREAWFLFSCSLASFYYNVHI